MTIIEAKTFKTHSFHGMLSTSKAMLKLFEIIARVAATESMVLIRGETGTGKELVARAIHRCSRRSTKPMAVVNCAMLTPELVNSELFGHSKGSFTGAVASHRGYFSVADTGTLFLDELAELPLSAQSRLLRAIQEGTITPVGSTKAQKVDLRIISATHKALRREVESGRFREDLMYRIRVVPIFLPPLRERGQDVAMLFWRFVAEFNEKSVRQVDRVAPDAYDALLSYHWPGNIRELRNNVEYAFAVGEGNVLSLDELPPELRGEPPPQELKDSLQGFRLPEGSEKARIIKALSECSYHRESAAAMLGIDRSTLWRKMKSLQIKLP